ncbi:DUF1345 domain-containing protein [Sphingomonas sp. ID1715]|uniref:DUF1345 domain-containing protein n=1 Tax=Sphingomonas sp. ID1715 TaxID=1656898 RepID=UPI0014895553|nr:DUF1345 domain-containing protein [Sphingomonas sp. ID1715]NNM77537.1 DUF1345 domain-containing protein [Sphingomonas sp. ID1715]
MRPVGTYLAPERFLAFLVTLGVATWLAANRFPLSRAAMIGFDVAALVFLLSVSTLMRRHDAAEMRNLACRNDANRLLLLIVSSAVMIAILVAVTAEVTARGRMETPVKILVIGTLALAWLFANTVYALHYAHIYYLPEGAGNRDRAGISFPGRSDPDYSDFVYFAFTLGMTFQTSDTEITSRAVRRVVTLHCLAAFAFNIGVLAFTINVLGSGS